MGAVISTGPGGSAIAVPPQCNIPLSYDVTDFSFFNSTHNLRCLEYEVNTDYYEQGCLDSSGDWCDPDMDDCSNCDIDYCGLDVPTQPLGYGPPDYVFFNFTTGLYCSAANSGGPKSRDVGNGIVPCGDQELLQFFGKSLEASSRARAYIVPGRTLCDNGSYISPTYDAYFDLSCSFDQGGNATCTSTQPLSLPLVRYNIS